jgi:hypothetical protein
LNKLLTVVCYQGRISARSRLLKRVEWFRGTIAGQIAGGLPSNKEGVASTDVYTYYSSYIPVEPHCWATLRRFSPPLILRPIPPCL